MVLEMAILHIFVPHALKHNQIWGIPACRKYVWGGEGRSGEKGEGGKRRGEERRIAEGRGREASFVCEMVIRKQKLWGRCR